MKKFVAIIVCLTLFGGIFGCAKNVPTNNDFSIAIEWKQKSDTTVEVKATFNNLTKKSYSVTHSGGEKIETMINIFSYKTGTTPQTDGISNKVTNKIESGAKIAKVQEFVLDKTVEYEAYAIVSFCIDETSYNFKSDIIKLKV